MLGENHSVHKEFPESKELIDKLMVENLHFHKLVKQYDALDKDIRKLELKNLPIDDMSFKKLKVQRSYLRDEIYQLLR